MRIAHLIASISRANGGISESSRRLCQILPDIAACDVRVLSLHDRYTDLDAPSWLPLKPLCLPVVGPRAVGYSPGMGSALREMDADVTHVAGLWMYPSVASRRWSRTSGRPYVVSPHGMLDAWALQNAAWKKKLAAGLFERAHLSHAACLHALCRSEADSIRAYGLRNPICTVPNGIDVPASLRASDPPPWRDRWPVDCRVMLFLGRLHPKKGLMQLLEAWSRVRPRDWRLAIAGWDQGGHQAALESVVAERGLSGDVMFCGPLFGPAKAAALSSASGFILPSFSEGLPMTVLEAWACEIPVLMTEACNLPEGFAADAALQIDTDPDRLAQSMLTFMQMSEADRGAMARRGKELAATHFSWERVARELYAVYQWVTGQGERPSCVDVV